MNAELADRVYYFFGVQPKDTMERLRGLLEDWTHADLVEASLHVIAASRILCDADPEFACPRCCGSGYLVTFFSDKGGTTKVTECGVCLGAGTAAQA